MCDTLPPWDLFTLGVIYQNLPDVDNKQWICINVDFMSDISELAVMGVSSHFWHTIKKCIPTSKNILEYGVGNLNCTGTLKGADEHKRERGHVSRHAPLPDSPFLFVVLPALVEQVTLESA